MHRLIGVLITIITVPVVLNIISNKALKSSTSSIYCFCMRPPKEIAFIGTALVVFVSLITILSYHNGQLKRILVYVIVALLLLGVFLMLLPVKGFWDVQVNNDEICSSRAWILKKTIMIEDIEHCEKNTKGILIYTSTSSDPVMAIESLSTNIRNFEKRMEKEGIEIRNAR